MILYLHGFRSSARSKKALLLRERLGAARFVCPDLPVAPLAAAALIERVALELGPSLEAVIGSSLGGYYATWLGERLAPAANAACRIVLLNPAVRPQRDLVHHLGVQTVYYSAERVTVEAHFLDELDALWVESISRPERYLLVAAKGDELLSWQEMTGRYPGALHWVLEGSDHGLSDFAAMLEEVVGYACSGTVPVAARPTARGA